MANTTPQADNNVTSTQKGKVRESTSAQPWKAPNEGSGGGSKPIRGQSSSGLHSQTWDEYTLRPVKEAAPPGTGASSSLGKWPISKHDKSLG